VSAREQGRNIENRKLIQEVSYSDTEEAQVTDDALLALVQDLDVAQQALDDGKYDKIVVQSNRMISEASVFEGQPTHVTLGLVARLSALELQAIVVPGKLIAYPQKQALSSLLRELRSCAESKDLDPSAPWEAFQRFFHDFWVDLRPQVEGKAYTSNPGFVSQVIEWSVKIVEDAWTLLGEPRGSPLVGIANEVSRVLRAHGGTAMQLACYGLVQSLAWYGEYAKWQSWKPDGTIDVQKLRPLLQPRVERVVTLLKTRDNPETLFRGTAEACSDILRAWRVDFTKYYDLFQQQQEKPRFALVPSVPEQEGASPKRQRRKGS